MSILLSFIIGSAIVVGVMGIFLATRRLLSSPKVEERIAIPILELGVNEPKVENYQTLTEELEEMALKYQNGQEDL